MSTDKTGDGAAESPEQGLLTVYTPESQLRYPSRLFGCMWQDLLSSRELAWRLTVRDITARYRRSLLGVTWAIFPPIAAGLVFIFLQRTAVFDPGETRVPYPVFVMCGTILWQLFTRSLNAPLKVITANAALSRDKPRSKPPQYCHPSSASSSGPLSVTARSMSP